jgi:hypothetical protein
LARARADSATPRRTVAAIPEPASRKVSSVLDSSIQLSPRDLLLRAGAGLAAALVLAVLALALPAGPAGATSALDTRLTAALEADQAPRFATAVQAFRAGDYAGAYGRFADLADQGHGPAAQWALAMASQGPTLFGSEWSATRGQLRRWSAISARSVREHAAGIADHDRGE